MRPLLLLCQMFPPEVGAASHRIQRLASFMQAQGLPVDVVTWFPHYPQRALYEGYSGWYRKESHDGISVRRFRAFIPKPTTLLRVLAEIWLSAGAAIVGLFGTRPGIVYATTPSALMGMAGWLVATVRRTHFILEVRDLIWRYPAAVADRPLNIFERLVERTMIWVASRAELIVTTTPGQADFFATYVARERLVVVPNGVERRDLEQAENYAKRDVDSDDVFTVTYTGMVGRPQGLDVLIEAAALLKEQPMRFVIVGDGVEKAMLEQKCATLGLTNVEFVAAVNRNELGPYYASADLLFAHLRGAQAFETALPSKLLDYMATSKAIVFGGRGTAAKLVREQKVGVVVPPDTPTALAQSILELRDNEHLRNALGRNGYNCVKAQFVSEELFGALFQRMRAWL